MASNPVGVLALHGFTGSPDTMRPVSDALAAAGIPVEAPRLPGHGTRIEDMLDTRWADWSATAEQAYLDLAGRVERVVVVGLSMGGTLAAWLATRHPELAGAVFINPAVALADPDLRALVNDMLEAGETVAPGAGAGSDIADPDAVEVAYDDTPLRPVLSLFDAIDELQPQLASITCPVLIMTSRQDHTVDPGASDLLATAVSGPVERITLERSYHVATHDYDKQLVIDSTIDFVRKVTASGDR